MIIIANFINFIVGNLLLLQFISLFISGIFLIFIIYFIIKVNFVGEKVEHYIDVLGTVDISRRRTLKAWKQIQKRLKSKKINQLKIAILEADRILNEVLKMAGYPGKNLEERLSEITPAQLSNIEEIQQVHKFRDRLVSELDLLISANEAEIAIGIYKKAFQELNLIE